jgi:zinc protease
MSTLLHAGLAPTRVVLDNGAVVLAKRSTATPAVTLHAMITAGNIHDPVDLPGAAYFVGRMLDRGTAAMTADQIAEELDNRGVSLQVRVTRHATLVTVDCLSEDFDAILDLLADVVQCPIFPEEQISLRRGETLTRLRQDEDNPAVRAVEELLPLLYGPAHPYSWRPRGTVASVERIDRTILQDFHRAWFAPGRLSLAVVGDVEQSRAVEAAARSFGGWRAESAPDGPLVPVPVSPTREVRVVTMPDKAQADIAYGFVTVSRTDPAYYPSWLMNTVLGQYGIGGRIGDDVRERQGLAYYAYSAFDPHVIPGPLMVRAGVDGANVDRTIASIDLQVQRMAAEGPTAEELADAKRFLIGSIPRTLETNGGIAFFLQAAEHFRLGLDYDLRLPGLIEAVTREQAHAAAAGLLPAHASIAIAGPYPAQEAGV